MGSVTSPKTKDDIMDEMVPIRASRKTKKLLVEHKNSTVEKKPYFGVKYGFPSVVVLFLNPTLSEEEIIEKFKKRSTMVDLNNYNKLKYKKV